MDWVEAEIPKDDVIANITGTNSSVCPTRNVLHNLVPTDLFSLLLITFLTPNYCSYLNVTQEFRLAKKKEAGHY